MISGSKTKFVHSALTIWLCLTFVIVAAKIFSGCGNSSDTPDRKKAVTALQLELAPVEPQGGYDPDVHPEIEIFVAPFNIADAVQAQLYLTDGSSKLDFLVLDANLRDGVHAELNLETIPAGQYTLGLEVVFADGDIEVVTKDIHTLGGLPGPYFVAPVDTTLRNGTALIEVDQFHSTANWKKVEFLYSTNGIDWNSLGSDSDGSDGWSFNWDLSAVPPGGYFVMVAVTDKNDQQVKIIRAVSRIYESHMYADLPEGPVSMNHYLPLASGSPVDLSQPEPHVPMWDGFVVVQVDSAKLPSPAKGAIRVTLTADLKADNKQVVMSTVEGQVDELIPVPLAGLPAGSYDLIATVFYLGEDRSYDIRSNLITVVSDGDPTNMMEDQEDRTAMFQELVLNQLELNQHVAMYVNTRSGEPVTLSGGWRSEPQNGIDFQYPVIAIEGQTSIVLNLIADNPVSDAVLIEYFRWDDNGNPVKVGSNSQVIINQKQVAFEAEDVFGTKDFMGFRVTLGSSGASLYCSALALWGDDTGLVSAMGLELGLGRPVFYFTNWQDITFNAGYPEYHWEKSDRVTNRVNPAPPADAIVVWKVKNADGSTWTRRGRELPKHASILGGPHHVRAEVTFPDGSTREYGSEHFVHNRETGASTSNVRVTHRREPGRILAGPHGPGGTLTYTQGTSVTQSVEVSTSISGTVGNAAVGEIETTTGVKAGQSVTKSISDSFSHENRPDTCGQLRERLNYKVTTGTVKKTFSDGTEFTGTFNVTQLESVGYAYEEVDCD